MNAKLAITFGLALVALPALAQEGQYGDDENSYFGDEQAPPPPDDGAQVDVSGDLSNPGGSVTFDTFHDGLAPYGEWVTVSGYGRVWRPHNVSAGWRPYYNGRWEWTDEGWLWVSDEPWGWAAYHYGRWSQDPSYGWFWIPGYQWAPAWVSWRYSPDYIGWAPLGPGFSVYVTSYPAVYNWWTFVPCTRFVGFPVHSFAYGGGYVPRLFHATQPAPPRSRVFGAAPAPAWGGPARPFLEHRIGQRIAPVRVQPVASPGAIAAPARAGFVPIYRPELHPAPGRAAAAAPGRGYAAPAVPNRGAVAAPERPWSGGAPQGVRPGAPAQAPRPSYVAPPRQQGQAPQQQVRPQAPAPRPQGSYAPAPRPQGYAPQLRQGYAPAPRPQAGSAAPPRPQAFSAPAAPSHGGGAPAPAPAQPHGGGGGGGGGHPPAQAHRR
ncbi:MAG: DUF6600 domain-containing protein [Anaeromyxobacteraceae bacterium]